jgi:hypothetical protein
MVGIVPVSGSVPGSAVPVMVVSRILILVFMLAAVVVGTAGLGSGPGRVWVGRC